MVSILCQEIEIERLFLAPHLVQSLSSIALAQILGVIFRLYAMPLSNFSVARRLQATEAVVVSDCSALAVASGRDGHVDRACVCWH
jgi:hypothetical protein